MRVRVRVDTCLFIVHFYLAANIVRIVVPVVVVGLILIILVLVLIARWAKKKQSHRLQEESEIKYGQKRPSTLEMGSRNDKFNDFE